VWLHHSDIDANTGRTWLVADHTDWTAPVWALDAWNVPVRLVDGVDPARREEWLDTVYSDQFMVTHPAPHDNRRMVTSSASLPTQDSRRLFDTIESAWHAWLRNDRPNRQRIGITARTDGTQRAWLDTPDSTTNWPLPTTT
jgi:hypothetical protein